MAIDTRITGDPDGIEEVARWLRTLAKAVDESVDTTKKVIEDSVRTWRDSKADEYRERWESGGRSAAQLSDELEVYAKVYDGCADALRTARGYVRQAIDLVTGPPYLEMSGDVILRPERADPILGVPDAGTTADENFEKRILAYYEAEGLVRAANGLLYKTLSHLGPPPENTELPAFLGVADYVNSTGGALARAYEQRFLREGERLAGRRGVWASCFRSSGAPVLAGWVDELADGDIARTQALARPYTLIGKVADISGKGLLAVGVGYNIFVHGEPWDKAILEGSGNYAGAIGGALLGGAIGSYAGLRYGAVEDPNTAIGIAVVGTVVGGATGGEIGAHAGDKLYQLLEGKTLIDDADYFK